jgi:hypothetical protein
MPLIQTLIARVAPAYTARVQFSENRDFHAMQAAMREADLIDKRDAMRTMFVGHDCGVELSDAWFAAIGRGECAHDLGFP